MLKFLVCPECKAIITARRNVRDKWLHHVKKEHKLYITDAVMQRTALMTERYHEDMLEFEDTGIKSEILDNARIL